MSGPKTENLEAFRQWVPEYLPMWSPKQLHDLFENFMHVFGDLDDGLGCRSIDFQRKMMTRIADKNDPLGRIVFDLTKELEKFYAA